MSDEARAVRRLGRWSRDQGQGGVRWTARGASQSVETGVRGGPWDAVVSDIFDEIIQRLMGYKQIIV